MTTERRKAVLLRDPVLVDALDRRVQRERTRAPGRTVNRESLLRELLYKSDLKRDIPRVTA